MSSYSYSYSYPNGGNVANGRGRFGGVYRSWDDAYGTNVDSTNGRSRPGWLDKDEAGNDHVCRPVILLADGRAMPVMLSCPQNGYIAKLELAAEGVPKIAEFVSSVHDPVTGGRRSGFPQGMFQRQQNGWNRPTDERNECMINGRKEPALVTSGGWAQPTRPGWATPPVYEGQLSKATNQTGSAVNFIQSSVRPSAAGSAPATIDSTEAARRYNGKFVGNL